MRLPHLQQTSAICSLHAYTPMKSTEANNRRGGPQPLLSPDGRAPSDVTLPPVPSTPFLASPKRYTLRLTLWLQSPREPCGAFARSTGYAAVVLARTGVAK